MHSFLVSTLVFAIVLGGAIAGMALRRALPSEHLGPDAKETVRLATGLIITMTGLVLGMLVSSAKAYYDGQKRVVAQISSQVIVLDSLFLDYGPEANQARRQARQLVEDGVARIWPSEKSARFQLQPKNDERWVTEQLQLLVPKDERQAATKAQIVSTIRRVEKDFLAYVSGVRAGFRFDSSVDRRDILAVCRLYEFWHLCPAQPYGDGGDDRVRASCVGCDLHHCGHVLAIQWHTGDFSCGGPRRIEPNEQVTPIWRCNCQREPPLRSLGAAKCS